MSEKFGKYEVVRQIGSGGFGAVYEARDPIIKRAVAIKTCHVQDLEVRERFLREAELAGNLHHRNLTTIYDIGAEGAQSSVLYLVCEFLPGEDLDKLMEHRNLALVERVEILIGIAYGLAYAHDAGVVHRDIKPGNIRILPDATVKVMDFGIAKSMYAERTLTRAGLTLGTASYLAPEQVRGDPVDRRTDVFSFGVLAYELLSGRRPFVGPSPAAILNAIVREEPPPVNTQPPNMADAGMPPALAALIARAMRKNPEDRYPSMDVIRRELVAIRETLLGAAGAADTAGALDREYAKFSDPPAQTLPPPRRWKRQVVALLALLAGAAAVAWLLMNSSR